MATGNSGTTYYATVSDPNCTNTTLTSTAATLTVSDTDTAVPPTIDIQPVGQIATVGGTATFSVTASGSPALTYQWYRVPYVSGFYVENLTGGTLISGATSSSYTVPSGLTAQSNDGDEYYVVVTNDYGTATSVRAVLAVGAGISIQSSAIEPQTEYIAANSEASFSVTVTCNGCIPTYQWYYFAPGATSNSALSNGGISSGSLNGATVSGATTSNVSIQNVPTSASGSVFYVVITSTSDGVTQNAGTDPLYSTTAGLFVGSLPTVSNMCSGSWILNGSNPGYVNGDVPYQNTSACTIELTNDGAVEHAAVYWPTIISTAKFTVSFTATLSASGEPADGFTMVLADPSLGATTGAVGATGEGIGAEGIPGFVLALDTYQNGNLQTSGSSCIFTNSPYGTFPCDPIAVPYMSVGRGDPGLWENPWTNVNGYLDTQNSADYLIDTFANASHNYVVSVANGVMTVTLDGYAVFTGPVQMPPAAYLGFTASTGGAEEAVTISNLSATVSEP